MYAVLDALDPSLRAQIVSRFVKAISNSFVSHPCRQTNAEVQRRFDICYARFSEMRGDLKWSLQRSLDSVEGALLNDLDGVDWSPSKRGSWYASPSGLLIQKS